MSPVVERRAALLDLPRRAIGVQPALNILIFNDSLDVLETLRYAFVSHGHRVATIQLSLTRDTNNIPGQMVERHRPHVIVFDVGIPYRPNWDFLEMLRLSDVFGTIPIVVTTRNKAALDRLVGTNDAFEMAGLRRGP